MNIWLWMYAVVVFIFLGAAGKHIFRAMRDAISPHLEPRHRMLGLGDTIILILLCAAWPVTLIYAGITELQKKMK